MAKKKAETGTPLEVNPGEVNGIAALRKEFGDGCFGFAGDIVDNPPLVFSTGSPAIDAAIHGGFTEGSIITISGPSGGGKTSLALSMASQWQNYGDDFKIAYDNAEMRLNEKNLTGIPGLRFKEMIEIKSSEDKILTCEDHITSCERLLNENKHLLLIIDSLSILSAAKEMQGDINTDIRGGTGKIMARFMRRIAPVVKVNKNCVIGIAHGYANVTGYGAKTITSMSTKMTYQRNTALCLEKFEDWKVGNGDKEKCIGIKAHFWVEKCDLGPPNKECDAYLRFGEGFDYVQETIIEAVDLALISLTGSWYEISCMETPVKLQGEAKVHEYLSSNPEVLELLKQSIKELGQ